MLDQKRQFRLYTLLSLASGIALTSGLIHHDHSFRTWLKLLACVFFMLAAFQARRAQHASKTAA